MLCGFALALTSTSGWAGSSSRSILILGDSLSAAYGIKVEQGWVALMEHQIKAQGFSYRIINASISGETTGGGLARLEALLKQHQPELLIIELGANDGLRGFPVKLMKSNLDAMIMMGQKYQTRTLLIGVQIPLNYGPRYTRAFENVFVELSQQHQLPLLPSLMGDIPLNAALMQADGLHPHADAQPLIRDRVWPVLKHLLKK